MVAEAGEVPGAEEDLAEEAGVEGLEDLAADLLVAAARAGAGENLLRPRERERWKPKLTSWLKN